MNKYRQTFRMFREGDLSDYFAGKCDEIQQTIQDKPEDYILNVNEAEYINCLIDKFAVDSINIDFEGIFIDAPYEKDIPAERFPPIYFSVRIGESYPKPATIYHLPYTGNEDLLRYAPSSYLSQGTEVFLDNQCFALRLLA